MARAKVFKDKDGNRMLFPGLIYESREDEPLATALWSYGNQMRVATGIEMEDGWHEFDLTAFPHVVTQLASPGFEHGGTDAYVFEGPVFDKVKSELDLLK